jgi:cytochrome P450
MITTFLHSEVQNPYKLYETMLSDYPVYWDNDNKLWAIYAYKDCKAILNNEMAHIPLVEKTWLNEYALLVSEQLARLSNGVQHEIAKTVAMLLFSKMKEISLAPTFEKLIENRVNKQELDWINTICKRLPINLVLKSFDFNDSDCDFISSKIEYFVQIMLPKKTEVQVLMVNDMAKELYFMTEKHIIETGILMKEIEKLSEKYEISTDTVFSFAVSNLIGLFIQSYDAGRGVLSNSLLQILKQNSLGKSTSLDKSCIEKIVIETLRFDPPIHNTRRVAVEDIRLNNSVIKKGDLIFIVLAAANRDALRFENPHIFDIERPNNNENLTFGFGGHLCLAKHFSINLTVETLFYLFQRYKNIKLSDKALYYKPMVNARLPKEILILIS